MEDEAVAVIQGPTTTFRACRAFVSVVVGVAVLAAISHAAGPPWTLVRSEHLTIVGRQSPKTLQRIAVELEQFREVLGGLILNAQRPLSLPTHVYVFDSRKELQPFLPVRNGRVASLGGYFHHDDDVNDVALALEEYEESVPIVFHEYTHLLVRNAAKSIPVWLNEGLAEYYSTYALESRGTRAHIGRPIAHHVALLRQHFMPLSQLIAVDTASALYNEGERRSVFYAEAWALTHYLMIEMPKGPAAINTYATAIARGQRPDEAFRSAFGSAPADFERELRRYVQRSAFRSTFFVFLQPVRVPAPDIGRPVSTADAEAWLGDLQRRVGRGDEAALRIEAAAALAPSASMPQLALGLLRLDQGRADEAWPAFERAVTGAPDDFFAQYSYGVSLLRQAAAGGDAGRTVAIDRARQALGTASAINPSSSDAFASLAYAEMMADHRLPEARAAITRAIELAPGRIDYRLRDADISILEGKLSEARELLVELARVTTDRAAVDVRRGGWRRSRSCGVRSEDQEQLRTEQNRRSGDQEK
jgi:tetratricopeptide (TPR) repeat protein